MLIIYTLCRHSSFVIHGMHEEKFTIFDPTSNTRKNRFVYNILRFNNFQLMFEFTVKFAWWYDFFEYLFLCSHEIQL